MPSSNVVWPLLAQRTAGNAFEAVYEAGDGYLWRIFNQQVDMIVLAIHLDQLRPEVCTGIGEYDAQPIDGVAVEHSAAIFSHKDQMDVHLKSAVTSASDIILIAHRPKV